VSGEPLSETDTSAFKANVMGFIDSVDTMILGANTYNQNKDYWPYADEQGPASAHPSGSSGWHDLAHRVIPTGDPEYWRRR
jgi:hypothetical protein